MGQPEARVVAGDCMRALGRISDGEATLVLTDPPYGINYKSWKGESVLNDDGPFIWWMREAFRITRPGGSLLCFCRWDVQEVFRIAATSAGYRVRSQVIWNKGCGGSGDCKAQFAPEHEIIWFATKGRFSFPAGRPRSVLSVHRPHWKHRTHPTEKPVALLEQLIEATTSPGELVVDPFAGSGSAGVAARRTGRRFFGVELDPGHARVARNRIRTAWPKAPASS